MIISRRNFVEAAGLASAALIFPGQTSFAGNDAVRIGGHAFGSSWTIVMDRSKNSALIKTQVERILGKVNASMSPYASSSEICQFNSMGADEQLMPSHAFGYVARAALKVARLTQGAFDPTVGPRVHALGFGPITGSGTTSWRSIVLQGRHLGKRESDATLDLCGIAKGFALDLVRQCLQENEIANALIEVGGEVSAIGHHPSGRHWRVAIESPVFRSQEAISIVEPKSLSLATSGHRANGIDGPISTSHIIPTASEQAANNPILSVSVLAKSAMLADALATALCAMEQSDATRFARERGINSLFAFGSSGGYRLVSTGRFSEHEIG